MAAFGHGDIAAITGEEAVAIARDSDIATAPKTTDFVDEQLSVGTTVDVMPIDYGFQPTQGELLMASTEEIVVKRRDARTGDVAVHFPRLGFQINESE